MFKAKPVSIWPLVKRQLDHWLVRSTFLRPPGLSTTCYVVSKIVSSRLHLVLGYRPPTRASTSSCCLNTRRKSVSGIASWKHLPTAKDSAYSETPRATNYQQPVNRHPLVRSYFRYFHPHYSLAPCFLVWDLRTRWSKLFNWREIHGLCLSAWRWLRNESTGFFAW